MATLPPLTTLNIKTSHSGFYAGFNTIVTVGSKLIIASLVIWAAIFPEQAGLMLNNIQGWTLANFGAWYMYVMIFYSLVALTLAIIPSTGSIVLGRPGEQPEFSRFSWFSMMFGAGIGVGMMTYATAEPIYHFVNNPETIAGLVQSESVANVPHALKWAFFHWGLSAWGCYGLCALSLAFFSFNRGLPLTIRSALVSLFGRRLEGGLGHFVDITAVIATLLGVAVTIGYGVDQFAAGVYNVSGAGWLVDADGSPTLLSKIAALVIVMLASTLSAVSGVGKGIKWLSNLNMVLSFILLAFFLFYGAAISVIAESLVTGLQEYLFSLPSLVSTYWGASDSAQGIALYEWQTLNWTVFIWVWWIGFTPFVGLFLARISRGRSLREFIFGVMVIPSLLTFIWFTLAGGTAIDLELNGGAAGAIINTGQESQLFATLRLMASENLVTIIIAFVAVPLLVTFLITSGDSAILVVNTINSGGAENRQGRVHIMIWGLALTLMIAALLLAGGMDAIRAAMIIGALPFSLILVLMGLSLITALIGDGIRRKEKIRDDRDQLVART